MIQPYKKAKQAENTSQILLHFISVPKKPTFQTNGFFLNFLSHELFFIRTIFERNTEL